MFHHFRNTLYKEFSLFTSMPNNQKQKHNQEFKECIVQRVYNIVSTMFKIINLHNWIPFKQLNSYIKG